MTLYTQKPNNFGFTLLEVLVVTGIIAALAIVLVQRMSGKNNEIKAVVREIAIASRDIRNRAKLQNATYRLVIEMKTDGDKREGTMWAESAPGSVLGEQEEAELKKAKDKKDEDRPSAGDFQIDNRIDLFKRGPKKLPSGMYFSKVELASAKKPFTDGRVYLYYLPQGYVEESVIQISYGEDLKWTVAIQPLTGKADIVNEHVDLARLRDKQ